MTSVVVPEADEVIDEYAATDKPTWYLRPFPRVETSRAEVVDVGPPRSGDGPTERPVDLDAIFGQNLRDQERVRTGFTFGLLGLFVVVILFALVASVTPYWPNVKDALLIVLPAITGVLGSTVAFYYLTVFGIGTRR